MAFPYHWRPMMPGKPLMPHCDGTLLGLGSAEFRALPRDFVPMVDAAFGKSPQIVPIG